MIIDDKKVSVSRPCRSIAGWDDASNYLKFWNKQTIHLETLLPVCYTTMCGIGSASHLQWWVIIPVRLVFPQFVNIVIYSFPPDKHYKSIKTAEPSLVAFFGRIVWIKTNYICHRLFVAIKFSMAGRRKRRPHSGLHQSCADQKAVLSLCRKARHGEKLFWTLNASQLKPSALSAVASLWNLWLHGWRALFKIQKEKPTVEVVVLVCPGLHW